MYDRFWQERDRYERFVAEHGEPVTIQEGVRIFADGAVVVQEFDDRLSFRPPPDDPVRRTKVQKDWHAKRLESAETAFRQLRQSGIVSVEARDQLVRLRDEVREHRQKLAEIAAALEARPEVQERKAREQTLAQTAYLIDRERDRLRNDIDQLTIDD